MGWNQWVAKATTGKGLGPLGMALAVAIVGFGAMDPAAAQIANSKHDLRPGSTNAVNTFDAGAGNTEICVFCHTPHGADTNAAVPLWNRVLAAPSTYTTYDELKTSSLDGKTLEVGSVSLACLSCHDGQTAMSTVINAPGSGNYNAAGFAMSGTWSGANQTGGKLAEGIITNIGQDLRNDHPIGIQYAGGGFSTTTPNGASGVGKDPDFKAPVSATLNNTLVWWVDTETTPNETRQKTDMILYTRPYEGVDQPFVECASCHDPHTSNATFLRISNAGSAVCLACHTK